MRGLSDLDVVCMTEIFKNLKTLDLCSMRSCSKKLRNFVDDHFYSLYFVREQMLDLEIFHPGPKQIILQHIGKIVRHLNVFDTPVVGPPCVLEVIANNCCDNLKTLHLRSQLHYEFDMRKFNGIFENLEVLHLHGGCYDVKYTENFLLGHEYPNLKTLDVSLSDFGSDVLDKFFMRQRKIKRLSCMRVSDDLLLLIALNAPEIEELDISRKLEINANSFMSMAQLKKLKRLRFICPYSGGSSDQRVIIELIKLLSANIELEVLCLEFFPFTEELLDAISKLTTLKELRLIHVDFKLTSIKSIEMLGRILSKLESLRLTYCSDFPYRNVLPSIRNLDKFLTIYRWSSDSYPNEFIEQLQKCFMDIKTHRWLVSENPLCIYLDEETFRYMQELLTQDKLKDIEKYGNIKIREVKKSIDEYSSFC